MITSRTLLGSLLTFGLSLLAVTAGALSARGADGAAAAGDAATATQQSSTDDKSAAEPYRPKSKAQLRRQLTPMQYRVTQDEATEPAFSNRYWNNKKEGLYHCIVCDLPLFPSLTKFESGTGWPSFYAPLSPDRIGTKRDWKMVFPRMEVHCKRCSAHLGHVFADGPPPTGQRYCLNSAALRFAEQGEEKAAASPAESGQATATAR